MFFCNCNKNQKALEKSVKDIKDVLKTFIPDNSKDITALREYSTTTWSQLQELTFKTSKLLNEQDKKTRDLEKALDERVKKFLTRDAVHSLLEGYMETNKAQIEKLTVLVHKQREDLTTLRDSNWISQETWRNWADAQEEKYAEFAKQWTAWAANLEAAIVKKLKDAERRRQDNP